MQEQRSHIRNIRGATANTPADPVVAANPQIASGNQSVARALSMLALLATVPDGMGVRDIAKRLKLAPSIVQRGINTLAASGFVERSHVPQRYRIGYTAFQVGNAFLNGSDLAEIATSELHVLTQETRTNTYLGVLRDSRVVYLVCVRSNSPLVINTVPGSTAPLHATAFGKALVCDLPDEGIRALLGREPYEQLTPKTKTSFGAVLADIREGSARGYFTSDGENLANVVAVGAPVRDAAGQVVAAISAATLRAQIRKGELPALCAAVRGAAERVSRRLGAPTRLPPPGTR